jgi:hypothetical protein
MAEKLRENVAAMIIEFKKYQFNISIGIATSDPSIPYSHYDLLA